MSEKRIPTQKRSIEKRNKIIEKGFELICSRGYYNTNTTQIAKYAGVSTGIIYQYFDDKKEIFLQGIKNYSNNRMFPMINILENKKIDIFNLNLILNDMLDTFIKTHTISRGAHEEIMAMSHIDSDVGSIFKEAEMNSTNKIVNLLRNNNIEIENAKEKVHIIIGIVENFCHEVVYHKHDAINYDIMRQEVIDLIKKILVEK